MVIPIKNKEVIDKRLDIAIPILMPSFSRSQIQKLVKENKILVNNVLVKSSYRLKDNDIVTIDETTTNSSLQGEDIPLDIIYEDGDVLVINKPRGLVVHPGNGNHNHTLVNALLYYAPSLSSIDAMRPGIVHRIDKDTSGLLVVAKNNSAHRFLAAQLSDHTMHREYMALVQGIIKENIGQIIAPIARDKNNPLKMAVDTKFGKEAETFFRVKERYQDATLVDVKLKQGRTHQIRVHFAYINHPVIGDMIYGRDNRHKIKDGQILHAYKISFIHPTSKKLMSFTAPLPPYFLAALKLYK